VHRNGALDPHQQTSMSVSRFLLHLCMLVLQPSETQLQLPHRRLNGTKVKVKTRIDTVRRMVIRASYKHCKYSPFAHLNFAICRADVQENFYLTLAIARPGTKKSAPPIVSFATAKPSPPIPPRAVGSKRKFVEDQAPRHNSNSINPTRKLSKLP
jgi:hypothetical protein